jgi:hypothetical protein
MKFFILCSPFPLRTRIPTYLDASLVCPDNSLPFFHFQVWFLQSPFQSRPDIIWLKEWLRASHSAMITGIVENFCYDFRWYLQFCLTLISAQDAKRPSSALIINLFLLLCVYLCGLPDRGRTLAWPRFLKRRRREFTADNGIVKINAILRCLMFDKFMPTITSRVASSSCRFDCIRVSVGWAIGFQNVCTHFLVVYKFTNLFRLLGGHCTVPSQKSE